MLKNKQWGSPQVSNKVKLLQFTSQMDINNVAYTCLWMCVNVYYG